ncbi:MAG: endonuclease/exonuclease/phosphatase family protein [Deltaproteobacteria bacterium]|nr:endonuclease/exonuclease/phosphatase family protein [Deltaproteobacteria bacterium]
MRYLLWPTLPILLLLAAPGCGEKGGEADERPLSVLTFNVMCSFCPSPGLDDWQTRLPHLHEAIDRFDADLIGLQELFTEEDVDLFLDALPGHDAFYYVDPDPGSAPLAASPDATVFWRRDRFRRVDAGVYWLSPTPDEAWSGGFADNQIWRLLTWVELEQLTDGRHLLFATTHFDNNSPSQERSAPVVVERTGGRLAELPVILTGDFNSQPADEAFQILDGTFDETHALAAERTQLTTEDPPPPWDPANRIDHLFVDPARHEVLEHIVDLSRYADPPRFPSDHWPVGARLTWPAG